MKVAQRQKKCALFKHSLNSEKTHFYSYTFFNIINFWNGLFCKNKKLTYCANVIRIYIIVVLN